MRRQPLVILSAAALLLGLGAVASLPSVLSGWRGGDAALAACRGGVTGGDIGGPFTLVDGQGRTVTEADVFTEPTILYFGYTFCPDVCPLDMARNGEAARILESRGIPARPVFVSVDPARDTPDWAAEWALNFHDDAVGLSGSPEQVDAAKRAWRVYAQAQPAEDGFYLVDHSTFSYLVLPEVGFVDFVRREESPEAVADRLQCFVEAAA
ncbi:SCO family protein [Rubellimicrobium sp. CFH 75288]|uniref:SCO family protein n=1 Tax=Rubellimicrobium sp. CFH 75288 TaxID=2697034 RepID=UPI001412525E|nr:SCO family protein [Rubellimicrobium sp. CFH 75288]NAZ37794.1 SCO family protein [Rubellimicrobium sp. CFH 75288]